jgi:cytochrome c oxidase accessory protein FixG
MTSKPKTPDDAPSLDRLSVIDEVGKRRHVQPADVTGRFRRAKPWVYGALILLYLALPWIEIGGQQAVLLDIADRRFFLFGATFNAQDFHLAFFILTGIGFSLIVVSALWGRVWCGWACPQTVFLDGVFRRFERWIEGSHHQRIRLNDGPWTFDKLWRKTVKHAVYLATSFLIAHVFLAYVVGAEAIVALIGTSPAEHPSTFGWALVMTLVLYGNFWWFREQLCIIICPYGRLQSALQDDDTLIIGYDERRGEPRGKAKDASAGDCVDCKRCIQVCPTGIDIRNGLQLECIGCSYCIDACDEIMTKLDRPIGLIRYDSERGLRGEPRRFWRPRVVYYVVAGLVGLAVAAVMMSGRTTFEANVLRPQGAPFVVGATSVENDVTVQVINKEPVTSTYTLEALAQPGVAVLLPQPRITLESFASQPLPVVINVDRAAYVYKMKVVLKVTELRTGLARELPINVLGPAALAPAPPAPAAPMSTP